MVNEPRNPIVRNRPFEKRLLVYPSHCHLVARHHHPHTVFHIGRDDGNVRHHHLVVSFEDGTVGHKDACHLSRQTGFERYGIGGNKIEVLPKMMLLAESDGINAGSMPELGALGTVAMARHHGTDSKQQKKNTAHKLMGIFLFLKGIVCRKGKRRCQRSGVSTCISQREQSKRRGKLLPSGRRKAKGSCHRGRVPVTLGHCPNAKRRQ